MTPQTARFLYVLGMILMLLGIADVALQRFGKIDLTGTRWSALVLGGTGIVLVNISRFVPTRAAPSFRRDEEEYDIDEDVDDDPNDVKR